MKKRYNVVLAEPSVQDQFLSEGDACTLECCDTLDALDGLVAMMLTEEEAENLKASDCVVDVIEELTPIEISPTPRSLTNSLYCSGFPSTATNGADYSSTFFHYSSDMAITANTGPVGWFGSQSEDPSILNQIIPQNYAGQYVDIVAIEAGLPTPANDGYDTHPDFLGDGGTSRFVRMDWDNWGSITSVRNRQVTNGSNYYSSHAIGVLSASGGLYCGWGKVSSLRVIYLSDGVSTAYNAVLNWHKNKPVNPQTGRRNATITTGAWGYGGVEHVQAFKVEDIASITAYDEDGNVTTINRPGGGWGNDLTPFTDNLISPRVITNGGSTDWWVTLPTQSRDLSFQTLMSNYKADGSIYHFKSAGNNAHVFVRQDDSRRDTTINTDAGGVNYLGISTDANGRYVFSDFSSISSFSYAPLRAYIDGYDGAITVGACQHSTVNPLPDDYSNRGPAIDIWAFGAQTWTAYPGLGYQDGTWTYFSGTSCAAPVAAGAACLFVDWFFDQRGEYPTNDQLIELMQNAAKPVIEEDTAYLNFSNVGTARDLSSTRLYSSNEVNRIKEGDAQNGGSELANLFGSMNKRVFIPYYITQAVVNNKSLNTGRSNYHYQSVDETRQQYPRRKIRLG